MVNKRELHHICNLEQLAFAKYGQVVPTPRGGFYIYIDRGSDILGVAHLDTVQQKKNFRISKGKVHSPRLDDRLGVYIMLKMLPSMGVVTDVLLTTDEEYGMSTAEYFQPDKQYNWMYSFDRAGEDVVMYQYETIEYINMLSEYGFLDVGWGSYSDLCELGHLGIMGINIGTGYEDYHSVKAYAKLHVLKKNVKRFVNFYHNTKDDMLEHTERVHRYAKYSKWTDENYYNGVWYCKTCGLSYAENAQEQKAIEYYGHCTNCISEQGDGMYCTSCLKDCSKEKYDRFTWVDSMLCEGCAYEETLRQSAFGEWEYADHK